MTGNLRSERLSLRTAIVRHEASAALVLCGALAWLAQFHHFRDFGLYEDDYWFISEAMGKNLAYLGTRLHTALTTLPQGRPLGFFLPDLLSFVGDKVGGLPAIYLLGGALLLPHGVSLVGMGWEYTDVARGMPAGDPKDLVAGGDLADRRQRFVDDRVPHRLLD